MIYAAASQSRIIPFPNALGSALFLTDIISPLLKPGGVAGYPIHKRKGKNRGKLNFSYIFINLLSGKKIVMIYLTKRGLLAINDKEGNLYYFDPANTLKETAAYISSNPNLSDILKEPDKNAYKKNIVYVDPPEKDSGRLRSFAPIKEDKYFEDELK